MNRWLAAVVLVGGVAVIPLASCGKGGDGGGGGGGSSLSGLAKGVWKGPYGTITVKDDGTVDLAIKNCGTETTSPGVVKVPPPESGSCSDEKRSGKLVIKGNELGVGGPDGATYGYTAFVDKAGKLHVAVGGIVNPIGADKKGTVQASMFIKVNVGDTCTLTDDMAKDKGAVPTKCHWEDKDGRTLFIFEAPDSFDKTKTKETGLVYLKDEGLLVSPELIDMVYTKT